MIRKARREYAAPSAARYARRALDLWVVRRRTMRGAALNSPPNSPRSDDETSVRAVDGGRVRLGGERHEGR